MVVTSIQDGFPNWIKKKLVYHELLVLIVCVVSFFFGLPNLIQGGIYFFQLIDHYAASVSIMFLAFFQMIAIGWFYGVRRLSKNIKQMTGKSPSLYFRSCWLIVGPLLLIVSFRIVAFVWNCYQFCSLVFVDLQFDQLRTAHLPQRQILISAVGAWHRMVHYGHLIDLHSSVCHCQYSPCRRELVLGETQEHLSPQHLRVQDLWRTSLRTRIPR